MRGAREVFYEYILELRGRMDIPSRLRRGMHVIAGEYHEGYILRYISESYSVRLAM